MSATKELEAVTRVEELAVSNAFEAVKSATGEERATEAALRDAKNARRSAERDVGFALARLRTSLGIPLKQVAQRAFGAYMGMSTLTEYVELEDGDTWNEDMARKAFAYLRGEQPSHVR